MSIEELYERLKRDDAEPADFIRCAETLRCEMPEVFNSVSLLFAKRFESGEVSYEDADAAMNSVWPAMLDFIMENNLEIIEPCYSVYCAFDEGEYDHKDGCDPVEKYTVPTIRELLKNA